MATHGDCVCEIRERKIRGGVLRLGFIRLKMRIWRDRGFSILKLRSKNEENGKVGCTDIWRDLGSQTDSIRGLRDWVKICIR